MIDPFAEQQERIDRLREEAAAKHNKMIDYKHQLIKCRQELRRWKERAADHLEGWEEARAEERERCAQIAEEWPGNQVAQAIASAIRETDSS